MTSIQDAEQLADFPLDVSMKAFTDLVKILNALGNEDALAIFIYAKDGISSSKDAIETLGLTQKRFYSRLKDLLDTHLVEKIEGEYKHTALGKILCDLGFSMEDLLLNKDKLALMNQLNRANISDKERNELMQVLSFDVVSHSKETRIFFTFNELVSETGKMLDSAQEEILMATQYIDQRVIDKGLKALNRGVYIRAIAAQAEQLSQAIKIIFSFITNPKQISFFTDFLKSPEFNVRMASIPYTFFVVDSKKSVLEIKDPVTDNFQFGFYIENEIVAKKLRTIFDSVWEIGVDLKEKIKLK